MSTSTETIDERWETGPPIHHGGMEQREVRRAGIDSFNGGHVCTAGSRDAEHIVMCHNRHYELVEQHAAAQSLATELARQAEQRASTLARVVGERDALLRAAKSLVAMNNCNYGRSAMRERGGFTELEKAIEAVEQRVTNATTTEQEHQP